MVFLYSFYVCNLIIETHFDVGARYNQVIRLFLKVSRG